MTEKIELTEDEARSIMMFHGLIGRRITTINKSITMLADEAKEAYLQHQVLGEIITKLAEPILPKKQEEK